jgi:hypothetical protein
MSDLHGSGTLAGNEPDPLDPIVVVALHVFTSEL